MSSPPTPTETICPRCETNLLPPPLTLAGTLGDLQFHNQVCFACATELAETQEQDERGEEIGRLLARSGGSGRMLDFTWQDATNAGAGERWLRRYLAGDRSNLLLHGGVGSGKTGLAWMIVKSLCEQGVRARLVNFRQLLVETKETFDGNRVSPVIQCRSVSVLALDDLGAERQTDWTREELGSLVEARYEARRPTIVTTNYKLDDLARRLGHDDPVIGMRIVSRLQEGAAVVDLAGQDRRLHR